jgi:hypothetical protein
MCLGVLQPVPNLGTISAFVCPCLSISRRLNTQLLAPLCPNAASRCLYVGVYFPPAMCLSGVLS